MSDIVIPIVFPDYKISVNVPTHEFDWIPYVSFDDFSTPSFNDKFSNLGHAGVLFINSKNGITKYFEYGRYDRPALLGIIQKIKNLPDVIIKNGSVDLISLKKVLNKISRVSGQSGRISGVYIEVDNKFDAMLNYARQRKSQNAFPKRKPYDLLTNSCIHFVKNVTQKAGVDTPWMFDPRPNSYIGEFRDDFKDLDYNLKSNTLSIESHGKY